MTEVMNIAVESEDLQKFKKKTGINLSDCTKILINSVKYGGNFLFVKILLWSRENHSSRRSLQSRSHFN